MKFINYLMVAGLLVLTSCHKDDEDEIIVQNFDTTIVYKYNASFVIENQTEITEDICPDYLKSGDKVAICAASNSVTEANVSAGKSELESWGLQVVEAENLYKVDGRYAGTLADRIQGFQKMIDDPEIKAIFFARGGYGAAQILPYVNWTKFKQHPKWIIGYSDVTAIHIALNNMGYESIIGPMMNGFTKDAQSVTDLKNALFGNIVNYTFSSNENCINGEAAGRLVGGNLSLIYSLSGTAFDLNTINSILFIEDTGEANYSIDRMLLNLQQSGKLEYIKGVIVGEFINTTQGSDLSIPEIMKKYFGDKGIPVMYGFPNGHDTRNNPLILGNYVYLSVTDTEAKLNFNLNAATAK